MARRTSIYLVELREACDALQAYTEGMDLETFSASRMVRSAVERELILIGGSIERIAQIDPRVGEALAMARPIMECHHHLLHQPEGPVHEARLLELARSSDLLSLRETVSLLLLELGDPAETTGGSES
ncbi:MAG: DUF86 domain-containing protein [Prochlorococcaceae cyanobacterium]|jgi:hypothetical protein